MNRIGLAAVAALALLAGSGAQAGYSWTYTTSDCSVPSGGASCTMTGLAAGTPTMTTTAYANTNGTTGSTDNYKLQTAYLGVYSVGVGVTDAGAAGSPAMDNNNRYDSVLLNFGSAVTLTTLTTGWSSTDSDMTVLAYTGTGNPVGNLTSMTYSQLTANGWTVIGHYSNVATNTLEGINAANVSSKFWLIGAFNPLVGGTTTGLTTGDDYVKLLSVAGDAGVGVKVPEPASLMLAGAALLALALSRRKTAGRH